MATVSALKKILSVDGVSQYILLGPDGQAISHNVDNHHILASMIISCTSICKIINGKRFRYLVFTQDDNRDVFIFPVGKHYLGVIKEGESDPNELPVNVANFLQGIVQ